MIDLSMTGNEAVNQAIICHLKRGNNIEEICHALDISKAILDKKRKLKDGRHFTADEAVVVTRVTRCTVLADLLDRHLNRLAVSKHIFDISIDDDGTEHISVEGVCDLATSASTGHSELINEMFRAVSDNNISLQNLKDMRAKLQPMLDLMLKFDHAIVNAIEKQDA